MKHTASIFFLMFLALCACGCDDHEDAGGQESLSSAVQVTVVFHPGQVGDHGYADDLMESVPQIGKLSGDDHRQDMDVQFLTFDSDDETRSALRHWTSHADNPFRGGDYRRRLLVLTDARQVAWLADVGTDNVADELLLLNTSKATVDSLALSWGDRAHALNISVARETADLCRYILHSMDSSGERGNDVDIYRMAGRQRAADSIDIVCRAMLPEDIPVNVNYMEEMQEDSVTGKISYVLSQQYAHFLADSYYRYNKDDFLLLDGGSYNIVFDELSPKTSGMARTVFLDLSMDTDNYCIRRQYGRALIGWIGEWVCSSSPSAMPRVTWHGSWDGYVESTVPVVQ